MIWPKLTRGHQSCCLIMSSENYRPRKAYRRMTSTIVGAWHFFIWKNDRISLLSQTGDLEVNRSMRDQHRHAYVIAEGSRYVLTKIMEIVLYRYYNQPTGCSYSSCKFAHSCLKPGCQDTHPQYRHPQK